MIDKVTPEQDPARQDRQLSATIIHIGAGKGKRLAELQAQSPERVILVEPTATMAAGLAKGLAHTPGVQVIHAALAESEGEGELLCWNMSRLNTLHEPTSLLQKLFPGLRLKERQPVPLITPARLVDEAGGLTRPSLLIIEAPGSELAILEAWQDNGLLESIDQIELHVAEDVLFANAAPRAVAEDWLSQQGFVVTARDTEDPDWTVLHLRADHMARALSSAEARIGDLSNALAEARATAASRGKQLTASKKTLRSARERATALDKALAEANAGAEEKGQKLAERDEALKAATERAAEIDKALAEANSSRTALEEQLAQAWAALESEKAKAAKQDERASKLEAELAEQRQKLTTLGASLEKTQAALDAAKAESEIQKNSLKERDAAVSQAYMERDKAYSDLGLATRMQGLLQVDLDELRARFRQSEETRVLQEDLLRKLTPRLQDAARQLRQLQIAAEPETAAGPPAASIGRARSKPRTTGTAKRTTRKKAADER